MATLKTKKTTKKAEKPVEEVPKAEVKKEEPAKKVVVEKKEEPKEVKVPKQQEKKDLSLKHKLGDKVKFSGKEWEVLVVVNKKGRERLRIGREGSLKAVWLEDLD